MKFAAIAPLLLSSVASAASIDTSLIPAGPVEAPTHQYAKRDVQTIINGLNSISDSTNDLTQQIKMFSVNNLLSLQSANAAAIQTIKDATSAVAPIDPITPQDTIKLLPVIAMLIETTNKSVQTTIDQKRAFGGVSPVVKANLMQQRQASGLFTLTVSEKLPEALRAASAQSSAKIFDSINMGIDAFSTPNVNTPENQPELFSIPKNSATSHVASYGTLVVAALFAIAMSTI